MPRNYHEEKTIEEKWREAKNFTIAGALTLGTLMGVSSMMDKKLDVDRTPQGIERSIANLNYSLDPVAEPLYSVNGKLLRAGRFQHLFEHFENTYQLEPGILAGLAIQESFAEPTMLNYSNDGGVGMFQFMPGTARNYGLNVHGNSTLSSRDIAHGREMRRLVNNYNHNLEKLIEYDERFDPIKSADAAAKYLNDLYIQHGNLDAALSAYNQGRPARNPRSTRHVQGVRKYQDLYLSHTNNK